MSVIGKCLLFSNKFVSFVHFKCEINKFLSKYSSNRIHPRTWTIVSRESVPSVVLSLNNMTVVVSELERRPIQKLQILNHFQSKNIISV